MCVELKKKIKDLETPDCFNDNLDAEINEGKFKEWNSEIIFEELKEQLNNDLEDKSDKKTFVLDEKLKEIESKNEYNGLQENLGELDKLIGKYNLLKTNLVNIEIIKDSKIEGIILFHFNPLSIIEKMIENFLGKQICNLKERNECNDSSFYCYICQVLFKRLIIYC
uniref:Uncharacterized protein n=1 Tax=Meloidogyne hapla TaxID=6305 RepID=A0A1I8BCD1_MELHA